MNRHFRCLLSAIVAISSALLAQQRSSKPVPASEAEQAGTSRTTGMPAYSVLNINNITSWHRRDGYSNHSPSGGDGLYFPRGTASAVYLDGVVWGGKVFTNPASTTGPGINPPGDGSQPVRVGGGTYNIGTRAGAVVGSGSSAVAEDPNAPNVRVFRIRRDYDAMTLDESTSDASSYYEIPASAVTGTQIDALRQQYATDWTEWPVDKGAPYIERNGTPGYQPPPPFSPTFTAESLITQNYDEPGVAGSNPDAPADQVLWTVFNDLTVGQSTIFVGSRPLGLEVQKTVWGYDRTDALGSVYFSRYKFINKGGVDTSATSSGQPGAFWIDSMYVCQWSDPDLGSFSDDLLGCDTLLSLAYVYNGYPTDLRYTPFNLPPPALGYDFLAGPVVPSPGDTAVFDLKTRSGFRNLGMSSFAYFGPGSPYSDPPGGSGNYQIGSGRWWKMLRGFAPLGDFSTTDEPYAYPAEVGPSKYPLSGDPVAGQGWVDGLGTSYSYQTGDRRLLVTTGPFSMAPGDTQEVVIGLVAGIGADRISSVAVMKARDAVVQLMYNSLFDLPRIPTVNAEVDLQNSTDAVLTFTAVDEEKAFSSITAHVQHLDGTSPLAVQLFDDGAHGDGASGDGVWRGTTTVGRTAMPWTYRASLVSITGIPFETPAERTIQTVGELRATGYSVFVDNLKQDGLLSPGEYARIGVSIENQTPFTLTAVSIFDERRSEIVYLPTFESGSSYTMSPSDTLFFEVNIDPDVQTDSTLLFVQASDTIGNVWQINLCLRVHQLTAGDAEWTPASGIEGGFLNAMLEDSAGNVHAFPFVGTFRRSESGSDWSRLRGNDLYYTYSGHTLPNGEILLASFRGFFRSTNDGDTWTFSPFDGTRTSILLANGNLLASSVGGVHVSTDGGVSWGLQGFVPATITSFAEGSSGVLLGIATKGLFRSTDMGVTWDPLIDFIDRNSRCILHVSAGVFLYGTDSLLWRTTDGGSNWTGVTPGGPIQSFDNMYRDSGGLVTVSAANDSIYHESTDGGASWSTKTGVYNRSHIMLKTRNGTLYGETRGIPIRSTDGGANWERIEKGMSALTINTIDGSGSRVIAGTSRGLFMSTNSGGSWSEINSGLPFGSSYVRKTEDGNMHAWAGNRLFRSTNQGESWQFIGAFGYPIGAVSAPGPGAVVVGLRNYGEIHRSTNNGASWVMTASESNPFYAIRSMYSRDAQNVIAGRNDYRHLLSADGGATWNSIPSFDAVLNIDASGDGTMYATGNSLTRSTNGGQTWELVETIGVSGIIQNLDVTPGGDVFLGTRPVDLGSGVGAGVFVREFGNFLFQNQSTGIGIGPRPRIASVYYSDQGELFAGTDYEGLYKGQFTTGVIDEKPVAPMTYRLEQNYPNPFNPSTSIEFAIPIRGAVTLEIFDLLGRRVQILVDGDLSPGTHRVEWDGLTAGGLTASTGVYFYRLTSDDLRLTRRMLLMR